jgi:hypothetical protein
MASSPTNLEQYRGDDGDDVPARFQQAIDLLNVEVAEEFQISERINSKGRQVFGLVAAFFAVAQTVAFGGLGVIHLSGAEGVTVAVVAVAAAVSLLVAGHRLADSEELIPEDKIEPSFIEKWARERNDFRFAQEVIVHLRHVADERQLHNKDREKDYKRLEAAARWVLIFTAAEVVLAVIFRA